MFLEKERFEQYKIKNPNELTDEQFEKIQKEMDKPKEETITDEYFDFKLWSLGYPSRQECFAEYAAKRLARKNAKKVLEVGCGRTYRLSRMLEQKGFEMTCIDLKVESLTFVKAKIVVKKQKFDYTYDLSGYDYIIAQEPCDATEHIVRACVEQNKPFIISLCGVPHKLISGKVIEDVHNWYEYLVNLSDKNEIRLRYASINPVLKTPVLLKN